MAPYDPIALFGKGIGYLIYLAIGMGFGSVLEMSGFGDTRKLAAQFYFKDMTVLKVMFTGIITAMLLIFGSSALGILDFDLVWVNTTFLWSQIVGGLILGVGFIIGGFCPGTSIVSASTLKKDGMFFVAGTLFGVFVFGEIYDYIYPFFMTGDMGRFTLPQLFDLPYGVIVFFVIIMALSMFYGAEISERFFGKDIPFKDIPLNPLKLLHPAFIAILVIPAVIILIMGQPTLTDKWNRMPAAEKEKFDKRQVMIHPGELLETMNDFLLYTKIIDLRSEAEFNLFHFEESRRASCDECGTKKFLDLYQTAPANTVIVIVSTDGTRAMQAYKNLKTAKITNLYILDGGINRWLEVFPPDKNIAVKKEGKLGIEESAFIFHKAVGSGTYLSNPSDKAEGAQKLFGYEKKIKIQKRKAKTGGCG